MSTPDDAETIPIECHVCDVDRNIKTKMYIFSACLFRLATYLSIEIL